MKILSVVAGTTLFACSMVCPGETKVACGQTIDAPLRSSAMLLIASVSSGVEVVGTDQEKIRVTCTTGDADSAAKTRLLFGWDNNQAKLTIKGPHPEHGNLAIRIEVPRKTNLRIQMNAGEVKVDEVVGDKDIEIHAGRIAISAAHAWNYKDVDASVGIGEVNARVYRTDKGGFFRSFEKQNKDGEFRLHARVTTGQIDLLGKDSSAVSDPN